MVHQSPFGGAHQWGTPAVAPTFSPTLYIPLQTVTSTPIYTMEVSSSSRRIEKFSGRPCIIYLKEFKATFSTVVCELEFKYGVNYTEAFAFKQLVRYVHYEALDVYEQHSISIFGCHPNSQSSLRHSHRHRLSSWIVSSIAHHGTVLNNMDPVPTSVNLSPQQLIVATANIPPTTDAPAFADPVGEFFRILELEFPVKSSEKILQFATFSRQKDETLKMLYRRLFKLKEDTQSITDLQVAHWYICSLEGTPTLHAQVLQRVFAKFGNSYTLLDVYNISEKLELAHAHYEASTMRRPSRSRPQPTPAAPIRSSHFFQRLKRCTQLHPSYLLATIMAILLTKLMSATFLPRISYVIIVGKKDIKNLSILLSS